MAHRIELFVVFVRYSRFTHTARNPRVSISAKPNKSSTTRGSRTRCVGATNFYIMYASLEKLSHILCDPPSMSRRLNVFLDICLHVRVDTDQTVSATSRRHRLMLI